jgi:uncharacterized membrane protein YcaP (DUF421 family)
MDIVLRAAFAYAFIVFVMRVMGRRELSSLSAADLILLVVLGDLIQNGVTQSDMSMTGVTIAISTFVVLTVTSSYLSFKSARARKVIEGQPLVVVQDGRLLEQNMKRERIAPGELAQEMREKEIASLDELAWAILETNGRVSFIKKS